MKTTIDIPDALYKRAKVHAIERGQTLKHIVIKSLEKELATGPGMATAEPQSYWAHRRMLPTFKQYWESGNPGGGPDSTQIISEDRDSL